MKKKNGFRLYARRDDQRKSVEQRKLDFNEFLLPLAKVEVEEQATRCMDCGVAFCHNGCPINNRIPEFNHAVANGDWFEAYIILDTTNNFPEFTGRLCPAPCESSCVLGINRDAVSIKTIEKHIIEKAFNEAWVKSNTNINTTGFRVAIVGSGPAGLTAADQLNKVGHEVVVYEKNDKPGGLLRYGIPDFKLDKSIIDRRLKIMEESGVSFICSTEVGVDKTCDELIEQFDAILLCCGAAVARDLKVEGRSSKGIYQAMSFLEQNNKQLDKLPWRFSEDIEVKGKNVVVIGGGDTGADCVGTSNRLGAASVTQIELLSKPGQTRSSKAPWPLWSDALRTSSSHEEGCTRRWNCNTKRFISEKGVLTGIEINQVAWEENNGSLSLSEVENTIEYIPCDIAFLAIGFLHTSKRGPVSEMGLALDEKGNVLTQDFQTNKEKVFACGDMRMGQSLIVWAIAEGRKAAQSIHKYLVPEEENNHLNPKSLMRL